MYTVTVYPAEIFVEVAQRLRILLDGDRRGLEFHGRHLRVESAFDVSISTYVTIRSHGAKELATLDQRLRGAWPQGKIQSSHATG